MSQKNQKLNLDKDELYNLYVIQQKTSQEVADYYYCTSRCIRNYLRKYDIAIRSNGEAVKLQRSKWSKDKENQRSKKFMTTWSNKSNEERQTIAHKKTLNNNSSEAIQKSKLTRFKNQTFTKSKAENNFYNKLKLFINEDDIIRGFIDNRYPFNCDFYIKSKDLFIEYQGHQTHGFEPYDPLNEKHLEYVRNLEAHKFDSTVFTNRDPNKLQIAKQNNIKLLLIYPSHNSYYLKNSILENIGKFDIAKINELC